MLMLNLQVYPSLHGHDRVGKTFDEPIKIGVIGGHRLDHEIEGLILGRGVFLLYKQLLELALEFNPLELYLAFLFAPPVNILLNKTSSFIW
jgi:hypothetical protein